MAASGRNYTIENCHWGDCTNSDDSSCPTTEWCPMMIMMIVEIVIIVMMMIVVITKSQS